MAIGKKVEINRFYAPLDVISVPYWQKHEVGDLIFCTENGAVVEVLDETKCGDGDFAYYLHKIKSVDGMSVEEDFRTLATKYWLNSDPETYVVIVGFTKVIQDNWFEKVFDMVKGKYPTISFIERLQSEQEYIEWLERTRNDLVDFDRKRDALLAATEPKLSNEELELHAWARRTSGLDGVEKTPLR